MVTVDEAPWALIKWRFHRLDSPSTPAWTLCGVPYHGWVWDAVAVTRRIGGSALHRPIKLCQGCGQRAARLARIEAGTALFPPARPVTAYEAQERARRRRAQELADLDRDARKASRSVSARSTSAGLPTLGHRQS